MTVPANVARIYSGQDILREGRKKNKKERALK